MIVQRGEDLLIFAQGKAVIEKPQSHRCAVSQGDLRRIDRQVICRCPQDCCFLFFFMFHPVADGIGIQSSPVQFNRRSDWSRMGGEKESRQVDIVLGKLKLLTYGLPAVELERW